MKTSPTIFPENKRYKIERIVDIIRDVVNLELIILFGSHAKGTQVEHRYQTIDDIIHKYFIYYDFLVLTLSTTKVYKNKNPKAYFRQRQPVNALGFSGFLVVIMLFNIYMSR